MQTEDAERDNEELIDMRHPNSITFGDRGAVLIGDNKGVVHVWDLNVEDLTNPV